MATKPVTNSVNHGVNFYDTTVEEYAQRKTQNISLRALIEYGSDGITDQKLVGSANFVLQECDI